MKLSRTERLILANQYRILEALYPDEADGYAHRRAAVESGYELEYERLVDHVYEKTLSETECREVVDTMAMFEAIRRAYDAIEDTTGIDKHRIDFYGYDGNNESAHMGYARYYCDEGNRFTGLVKGDHFNSHMPVLQLYRPMLRAWKQSEDPNQLTRDDLVRITSVEAGKVSL